MYVFPVVLYDNAIMYIIKSFCFYLPSSLLITTFTTNVAE